MKTESSGGQDGFPPELLQEIIASSLAVDEEDALASSAKIYRFVDKFFMPTVVGVENIPAAPCLFIGNHSGFALDVLAIMPVLHNVTGRFVRGMADRALFLEPTTRKYVIRGGSVMADPQIGEALLAAGKDILLFPGGSYEATKDLSQRYEVMWKDRTGFVRLAASQGVSIVPFGAVGPEEWYDRYMARSEVRSSFVGKAMKMAGFTEEYINSDSVSSIPKGLFGTLLPKPQPVFMSFGEPIPTIDLAGKKLTKAKVKSIRDKAKAGVEACIGDMLLARAQTKDQRGFVRRLLTS